MKNLKPKILIVDDESGIRFALTEALRSWGYESVPAASVAEAIKRYAEESPAVSVKPGLFSGWYLQVEGQSPRAKVRLLD